MDFCWFDGKENVGAGLPGIGIESARAIEGTDERLVAIAVAATIFLIPALKFQEVVTARQRRKMLNRSMMEKSSMTPENSSESW